MSSLRSKDPTQQQIAAECKRIQAGWSAEEKMRRLRADLRPTYRRCDGVRETIAAAEVKLIQLAELGFGTWQGIHRSREFVLSEPELSTIDT